MSIQIGCSPTLRSKDLPNIIFILVDDLGWSDLASYGHPIHQTPNIDQLTNEGIRFTNAYAAAPICSPTRAAILTGKSPAQLHFEFVSKPNDSKHPAKTKLIQPSYPRDLNLDEETIAELIDEKYATGFFGKWHLTQENERYLGWGNTFGPLQQGFQSGTENRGSHPYNFSESEKNSFGDFAKGAFPQDELIDQAIEFIQQNKSNPFFLYLSLYYVHTPVQTRCQWLYAKYDSLLGDGADPRKIHYAAFVETMDHYSGKVLKELEKLGLEQNTLVILTSDNGGHPGYTDNHPLRGNKWNLYEGGIRVPTVVSWPGVVGQGAVSDVPITSVDWLPTLLDITNTAAPDDLHFQGQSILPLLRGAETPKSLTNRTLTWHFPFYHPAISYEGTTPCSAIRMGNYKLIYFFEDERCELYDLMTDLSEDNDLCPERPEIASKMKDELFVELSEHRARFPKQRKEIAE